MEEHFWKEQGRKMTAVCLLLFIFLGAAVTVSGNSEKKKEGNLTYSGTVTKEMCDAQYWIHKCQNPDEVLLTREEIEALNEKIMKKQGTHMNDLSEYPDYYDGEELRSEWTNKEIPQKEFYRDGELMEDKEAYFSEIRRNILEAKVEKEQPVSHVICIRRTGMKVWPTDDELGYSPTDVDDELLNSVLLVNEPAVVLMTTADGRYCYTLSSSCSGWVKKSDLAFCKNKQEWNEVLNPDGEFLIITTDKIVLEDSNLEQSTRKTELTLGSRVNLVPDKELPSHISERGIWNNYVVYLPSKDANGYYVKRPALISQHENVSVGYLKLNQRNILNTAFECLGDRYGWGGMLGAMDCSLYTRSIFRCFGLELPRNTKWQNAIPTRHIDLSEQSDSQKKGELNLLPAGTLLFFTGHIMMYVGNEDGHYYVMNAAGSLADVSDGEEQKPMQRVYSVILNSLEVRRKSGNTWLRDVTDAIVPWEE